MIKFNRVNGWTYKTTDNKFLVYNGGPNEWYSAEIDPELVTKYGYCSVAVNENTKQFHYSLKYAQLSVRKNYEKAA